MPDYAKADWVKRAAFEAGVWSRSDPAHRKGGLLKLADLIRQNLEKLALLDSPDMGKLVMDARTIDAPCPVGERG